MVMSICFYVEIFTFVKPILSEVELLSFDFLTILAEDWY